MLAGLILGASSAMADNARVFFVEPTDGATIPGHVKVVMGAEGLTIEPAGKVHEHAGHFHLIIDGSYVPKGRVVPKDEKHLHFGKGQKETILDLSPGKHTLTLQFADGHHVSYGKKLSQSIQVMVK
ncbi:MAG: DUF4399 domain-containing protein [Zetaproteobacteria bacterium]|nr:MAG: DUF4399 domain-containing protein [Zetaproteobacteria bacterium]